MHDHRSRVSESFSTLQSRQAQRQVPSVTASFAPVPIDDDEFCFLSRSVTLSVSPEYIMSLDM